MDSKFVNQTSTFVAMSLNVIGILIIISTGIFVGSALIENHREYQAIKEVPPPESMMAVTPQEYKNLTGEYYSTLEKKNKKNYFIDEDIRANLLLISAILGMGVGLGLIGISQLISINRKGISK
jgi:hypothetical protein